MFSEVKYQNSSQKLSGSWGKGYCSYSDNVSQVGWIIHKDLLDKTSCDNVTISHIQSLRKLTGLLQDKPDLALGTYTGHITACSVWNNH
jgi:hypothetical protein